jgi:hypothetical protein
MPGYITHQYICHRVLDTIGRNDPLEPLAALARNHHDSLAHSRAGNIDELTESGHFVPVGCAHIGACGPDMFYPEMPYEHAAFYSDLMHYNRTGQFLVRWLLDLRDQNEMLRSGLSNDLLWKFCYVVGHATHIAADIVVHPYVNSIVTAYPLLQKLYEDFRGWNPLNIWKFHNILEAIQDSYVWHEKYQRDAGFASPSQAVNLAYGAGWFMRRQKRGRWIGFTQRAKDFYRVGVDFDVESDKYAFFSDDNFLLDCSAYFDSSTPDRKQMREWPDLVQGNLSGTQPGIFDDYIERAVALGTQVVGEIRQFMLGAERSPRFDQPSQRHRVARAELEEFPILGRAWNLDCGLALAVQPNNFAMFLDDSKTKAVSVPVSLSLEGPSGGYQDDRTF